MAVNISCPHGDLVWSSGRIPLRGRKRVEFTALIQSIPGGKINIPGGHSIDHSTQKPLQWVPHHEESTGSYNWRDAVQGPVLLLLECGNRNCYTTWWIQLEYLSHYWSHMYWCDINFRPAGLASSILRQCTYSVFQEERSVFREVIVSVILSKKKLYFFDYNSATSLRLTNFSILT